MLACVVGAALAITACGVAALAPAAAKPADEASYRGQIAHGGRIDVTVRERGTRPRRAIFKATDIAFQCDDGTSRRLNLQRLGINIGQHNEFEFTETTSDISDFSSLVRVHGKLVSARRIEGFVFMHTSQEHPAGSPTPDTGCTTVGGKQGWTAKREAD